MKYLPLSHCLGGENCESVAKSNPSESSGHYAGFVYYVFLTVKQAQ